MYFDEQAEKNSPAVYSKSAENSDVEYSDNKSEKNSPAVYSKSAENSDVEYSDNKDARGDRVASHRAEAVGTSVGLGRKFRYIGNKIGSNSIIFLAFMQNSR